MKNHMYLIIVMAISLSSCSSQKKLQTETPFTIGSASCQEWVGGREESGSGFSLMIPITMDQADAIVFKEVFFRGHLMETALNNEGDDTMLVCKYKKEKKMNDQSSKLEKDTTFPFELTTDEAVLSYSENGTKQLKYVKIAGIKDKAARIYPSKPQN